MTYKLSDTSLQRLVGVHPDLVKVVRLAITTSEQDFGVHEGLRSLETQKAYVRKGVSRTLASKHLRQSTGYGHAVDLVPFEHGLRWEWPLIYPVAVAMRAAANKLNIAIRWGGIWDVRLNDLPGDAAGIKKAVAQYCIRHAGPDFLDGPHYELMK